MVRHDVNGYLITDGREVVDGKRDDGSLAYYPLNARAERDAFVSSDLASKRGNEWGVQWGRFHVLEVHSGVDGRWL